MTTKKSLPPHLAEKMMETMQKAGTVSYLKIDGTSMEPFIMNGEKLIIDHRVKEFEPGDIILFERDDEKGQFLHRIVYKDEERIITKGDNRFSFDKPIRFDNVKGKVTAIEKDDGTKVFITDEPWKTFSRMTAKTSYKNGVFHKEMMKEKAEGSPEKIHKKAFDLYKKGKTFEALDLFREAVALDPGRALTRVDMGEILRQQGKYNEAVTHLRLALEIDRRESEVSAQAYNILGNTLSNMGRYRDALEEYISSIDVSPEFVPPYINRGWAYFKLGQTPKAEKDYKKALELEPGNFKALKNIALLYLSTGNFDEAHTYLEKAFELKENDPDILNNLAIIHLEKNELQKAEKMVRKALEIKPTHYEGVCNLGVILERQGKLKDAVSHYSSSIKKYTDDDELKAALSKLLKTIQK